MGARMDQFWVPPDEFGPPRDLDEIAAQLQDVVRCADVLKLLEDPCPAGEGKAIITRVRCQF